MGKRQRTAYALELGVWSSGAKTVKWRATYTPMKKQPKIVKTWSLKCRNLFRDYIASVEMRVEQNFFRLGDYFTGYLNTKAMVIHFE